MFGFTKKSSLSKDAQKNIEANFRKSVGGALAKPDAITIKARAPQDTQTGYISKNEM